jgi:acetyl esterase/lipase
MSDRSWLLTLTILLTVCPAVFADTTGTALRELKATPPQPPPGFPSREAVLKAMTAGQVKAINVLQMTPASVSVRKDISYGSTESRPLKLDLYSPQAADGPVPGLVFIHGGGWKAGKKEDYRIYGLTFAQKGYVVASVQYRLSGEAQYPAAIHDVKAAVRWMRSEAASIGVDPDRIGVAGGSAGGHLAMMVGYTSDVDAFDGNSGNTAVSSRVQAVVDIYGPTDLTTDFARSQSEAGSVLKQFLGGTYEEQTDRYIAASPIRYVTPDDPPTLILHGTIDEVVPINQSDLLVAKLKEVGVPYIYDRLPGWPHAMDIANPVNERCVWFMQRFFDRYLKHMDQ